MTDGYLRYPHVRGDLVTFVAQNDVWVVPTSGGRASRLTSDGVPVRTPHLSPDGTQVAWVAVRDGSAEVHVAALDGGTARQLTFWGQRTTSVTGWTADGDVIALSATGEPRPVNTFAHAVPVDGSPSRRLPYGHASHLALGPDDRALLSTYFWTQAAHWKRYRGGTANKLWIDLDGSGDFTRVFDDLTSCLVDPVWTTGTDRKQRIGFVSDHEGTGQLYVTRVGRRRPRTADLERRTDHAHYVRHATSDGRQVVYCSGGDLYLLPSLDDDVQPQRIEVSLAGGRSLTRPHRVDATDNLETLATDRTGRASALESRGTISWVSHRGGPARLLATGSDVRRRLPVVLDDRRVAWVSDADGDDRLDIVDLDDPAATPAVLVRAGRIGRVLETAASPDGRTIALATHDGRLLTVAVPAGRPGRAAAPREVDSLVGDVSGLAFSPDSRWLAYSASGPGPWEEPGPTPLRHLRLADLDRRRVHDVTTLRFTDNSPVFTPDGRHLAFLSVRSLDPSYDVFSFDLGFAGGCRPYLVPLAATTPSPFDPVVGGWSPSAPEPEQAARAAVDDERSSSATPTVTVDVEGIEQRISPVPVEAGRCSHLVATKAGLAWLRHPATGQTGDDLAPGAQPQARVEHVDLTTRQVQTIVKKADRIAVSGDGSRLVVLDGDTLAVVPSDRPASEEETSTDRVDVDLGRVRVEVQPHAEWRQMFDEAWRLMRDHFWRADMGGVDWEAAHASYAPLVERLGSHDDLVDLIWELHGELGSSHAYCSPPRPRPDGRRRQGQLGADLALVRGRWQITRVLPGDSSDAHARSPLMAAGVGARAGESIVAVDGVATSPTVSPQELLVGAADRPVELTLRAARGGDLRRVVVTPLADETTLRYQDWVAGRRSYVREQTDGRVGYLHVPDMMSEGWAQLHRDLRTELVKDAVIVDVRDNGGGHTSQLVIEKLARRIIGWDLVRGYAPESYPSDARRGPMVALADQYSGSDGDIVTAAIQSLGLGPVIGTRTWGGVIGIDGKYHLVDGTGVTQPRFAFWFEKFGWGVENHGVDPDIEVVVSPQQLVAGEDPQLDRALAEITDLLAQHPPLSPPSLPTL